MIPERLGPYRIERLLGSGGMGAVYAGVNDETGDRAAIKVLAQQIATDANFRARFEGEIETLKKLKHENIVQLYGFGEHQGQLFYSMELVDGTSLHEKLKEDGPLPWQQAVAIGIEVALALKHAHDRGIIHRDLKPANLLFDTEGKVKLTDFGIAKLFGGSSLTAAGGVMGTADYMAPEQAEGKVVNHRVDLYSLGGVLYALLTGRPPFMGNSLVEVLDMLRHDQPTPVSRLMPKVPKPVDAIVLHLLEKDPAKRLPTALAAANQLRSLAHALGDEKKTLVDKDHDFQISDSATEVTPPSDESARIASRETAYSAPPDQTSDSGADLNAPTDSGSAVTDPSLGNFHAQYYDDTAGDAPTSHEPVSESSHFTTVSEDELGQDERSQFEIDDDNSFWTRLIAIAVGIVVLGLLGWYTLQPPDAAQLWSEIEAAASDDDPNRFYDAEERISQFVAKFPDHENAELAREYLEEIELLRLQRRLERRLRRTNDPSGLAAIEQLYLESIETAASDPHKAANRLDGLIALYDSDTKANEDTRQIVDLARRQRARLAAAIEKFEAEHLTLLDQRIKFAKSLEGSDQERAIRLYRAIIELYDDKPFAEKFVAIADERLVRLTSM